MSGIIGNRIKELRQAKEWSGEYLAKTVGVSQSMISAYERGIKYPSRETLKKLANALGVSMDAIAGDDSNEPVGLTLVRKGSNGYVPTPIYKGLAVIYAGELRTEATKDHPTSWENIPVWLFGIDKTFAEELEPFIVEVRDNALEPSGIGKGDLLCVNPNLPVNDGDLAFVELDGVKLARVVFWYRDGGGELQPIDTRYPIKQFSHYDVETKTFRVLGKVTYVLAIPKV